jgi:dCTP deaminase
MIVNGVGLLLASPIVDMVDSKIINNGMSYGLGEAGYDIRIKQEVRHYSNEEGAWTIVDGIHRKGRFAIASSCEEFTMPEDLVGYVKDKSSWARQGLSVFNTVIEPGWKGFLTLELVFHGEERITIPAGAPIAQVLFHRTELPAAYNGKYQDQADAPVPAKT